MPVLDDTEDMATVGRSLMDRLALHLDCPDDPLYQWAPADDPAEVVSDLVAMIEDLREEVAKITAQKTPPVVCYWDPEDNENGYLNIAEITDQYDLGTVVAIDHVAVVKTTFHARLAPAADANSDDEWEFVGSSEEETQTALEAELSRRQQLDTQEKPE